MRPSTPPPAHPSQFYFLGLRHFLREMYDDVRNGVWVFIVPREDVYRILDDTSSSSSHTFKSLSSKTTSIVIHLPLNSTCRSIKANWDQPVQSSIIRNSNEAMDDILVPGHSYRHCYSFVGGVHHTSFHNSSAFNNWFIMSNTLETLEDTPIYSTIFIDRK